MGRQRTFRDSLKILEADIHDANSLLTWLPCESDGAYFQTRISLSPIAPFFLFFLKWIDCNVAGFLGLLHVLIYKVYVDGSTTISVHERRASLNDFYGTIYPSLMQLHGGLTDKEIARQVLSCRLLYSRGATESFADCQWSRQEIETQLELESECGICFENEQKIGLPECLHTMCCKCFNEWKQRATDCPFCRSRLDSVSLNDVWVFVDRKEVPGIDFIQSDNLARLLLYIDKLPVAVSESFSAVYDFPYC